MFDIFHSNGAICIVTEYHEQTLGQLLHPKIKRASESDEEEEEENKEAPKVASVLQGDKVKSYLKQILTGLAEMHEKNVWHRDVTPGNLLLTKDETIKFIDFGISKLAEKE